MPINDYLRQLLCEEGKISLPGVGVIRAHSYPAQADLASHTFTPPGQRVSFTPSEEPHTALMKPLLSISGAKKQDIEPLLSSFIERMQKSLKKEGSFEIQGIGRLLANKKGKLSFSADPDFNTEGMAWGLQSFQMKPCLKMEAAGQEMLKAKIEEKKFDFSWVIALCVVIILLGAGYLFFLNYFNPTDVVLKYMAPQNTESSIRIIPKSPVILAEDSAEQTAFKDSLGQNPADSSQVLTDLDLDQETDTSKVSETLSLETTAETLPENFFIVAGVFRGDRGVQRTLNKLKDRGYQARVFKTTSKGVKYVCYGSYNTLPEAERILQKIQSEGDKDAWIKEGK